MGVSSVIIRSAVIELGLIGCKLYEFVVGILTVDLQSVRSRMGRERVAQSLHFPSDSGCEKNLPKE